MHKYIILFFFCYSFLAYSQEKLKVNYEAVFHMKTSFGGEASLAESVKKEILEKIENQNKQAKKYVLYYSDGNSYFTKDNFNDKSFNDKQADEYFKVKDKNGFFRLNDFKVEEFYGYYPDNNFEIEYKDETLKIENYTCKLAILKNGKSVSRVWYTEEIPISVGPFNYNNLPGLVLKVETPNYLCYATHISNDVKPTDLKKMDPNLKVYQGEELKLKNKEGLEKMRNHSREVFEMNKKRMENSK
ncbi:GLPGLI family protein [Chryseobacterium arachidis]|uniref:GLPGLI family protein n=1 Tax=Chryseobacterium arachidis TaxID=1416778 RepID=A0A1M5IR06_9FLAO|nr:GLPGLI family protein [Chryseobacterium arachidis]SHG30747.1 GLPGLI family protein [Chryseobacterium arachidis]